MTYRVVVPSSAARLPHVRSAARILPAATLFVPDPDRRVFELEFGAARIAAHPPGNYAEVLNAMLDAFPEPCLVHVADGFTGIDVVDHTRGRTVRRADPAEIAAVIDNACQVAEDLDLAVFGWTARNRYSTYEPFDPLALGKAPVFAWGVRGAARSRRFDPADTSRVGWMLRAFAEDRIVLTDQRFQFDADNDVDEALIRLGVERRLAMGIAEAEFKILVDARNEAGLSSLYEEMMAKGFEAKLIT